MNKLLNLSNRESFRHLFNYVLIGLITNFIGYIIYLFVTYLGITPKLTMTIMYSLCATVGYIGNRNYTFEHQGGMLGSGARYFIAHFFGYFINLVILIIFVDHFMYPHQLVQAFSVFVVASFLFITFKFFVFSNINASNA